MSDTQYNPDDLAFLVSRSLDEELSEAEQSRLDSALASSEALRREGEELRAVDGLVKRWGSKEAQLDWEHHHALIGALAAGDENEASRKLDDLLARWAAPAVLLDERKFTEAVMARVDRADSHRLARKLVFRLGVPLAAAAMVAFALLGHLWLGPAASPVRVVIIGGSVPPAGEARDAPQLAEAPIAVVSFAREPADIDTTVVASSRFSYGSAGATPLPAPLAEAPPL